MMMFVIIMILLSIIDMSKTYQKKEYKYIIVSTICILLALFIIINNDNIPSILEIVEKIGSKI